MDSPASAVRRPCFAEEDDGLASIAEFSGAGGNHYSHNTRRYPVFSRIGGYSATASTSVVPRRTGSLRNLASLSTVVVTAHCSSPRSGRIFDPRFEEANHSPHFLEACFLCKKPLGGNKDIFMYRGDMPFCSEECRREQIEVDEAKEKSLSLSASMKAMRKKQKDATSAQQNAASSPDKSQKYRAGTVRRCIVITNFSSLLFYRLLSTENQALKTQQWRDNANRTCKKFVGSARLKL